MNYRDFFKNRKATAKDILSLLPEGVNPDEFKKGIGTEKEHTDDEFTAAKIAGDHLKEDPKYYTKLSAAGLEEEDVEEHCGACEDDLGGEEYPHDDYNGGLPKLGGALAVPHLGDPIRMAKIIQVGGIGGGPANGALGGMTNAPGKGVAKDQGGVKATEAGDKEPLTAGGKSVDSSIASKSVGGSVVPGEGQKQGGPNSQGTIADTARLTESKGKVRQIVKEVLKEIRFDKQSGKWVRIDEAGHKAGCKCAFCANKGKFGKKKDKEEKPEEMDEEVNMKMGASYKTVQPRMYDVQSDDRARTNQYDPEITEMYDDEEECMMNERYVELANASRNLSEAEIAEMKTLREKIDNVAISKRNWGASQGGVEPNVYEGRCEDFPCCGHEPGDCPDRDSQGNEVWKCAGCGGKLPKGSRSSLCRRCIQRVHRASEDPTGQDMDNMFGGGEYQMEENTVDMKMGPSYKTVQPTLAKTAEDDFARTNQYDPQVSEAGGGAVQHSSYRTQGKPDHGNLPQDPKTRWANDLDEANKPSKVSKAIAKGQKTKKTKKNPLLKFQKAKKTSSGVHKRKP